MTRRALPYLARSALAVVLTAGAAVRWSPRAGSAPDDLASVTVTAQPFVRRVTAEGTLRAVTGTEVVLPQTAEVYFPRKLAWLAPDGTVVQAGDIVARFDPSEVERQLRDAQADLDTADVKLREQQLDATLALADRDAAATLARDEAVQKRQFQATDPMTSSRNEIVEAELDARLAAARQAQAEQARGIERRVSRANVALLAIERQRAALALAHTQAALANMVVRAPSAGIFVVRRDDHGELPRLGAELSSSTPIADIPALDPMEAELFVLEVDASGLEVGQPAEVVIEARPGHTLHGKLRLVDKLAKPRQPGSPVQYISAVVALDETWRDVMKPGQRVRATLVTDQRTALVVPRQAVFEQAGQPILYRRGAHGWAAVPVELGPATAGRVVVTSGLAEGDVVAERDPTRPRGPATEAP